MVDTSAMIDGINYYHCISHVHYHNIPDLIYNRIY